MAARTGGVPQLADDAKALAQLSSGAALAALGANALEFRAAGGQQGLVRAICRSQPG